MIIMSFEDLYELGDHWQDLAGTEDQKRFLDEYLVEPLLNPPSLRAPQKEKKSLLLYGPPGVGKSYLLKSMARKMGQQTVFRVFSSDMISKWQDSVKLTDEIQEKLSGLDRPCIFVIDEMETLKYPECSSWKKYPDVKSSILKLLRGDVEKCAATVCVSNNPNTLDPDFMDAFISKLYIPLPDMDTRCDIFKNCMTKSGDFKHYLTDNDFKTVAEKTEGFTGADLSCIVRDVLMEPIRKIQRATHFVKVQKEVDGHEKEMLAPCDADETGAIQMDFTEVDEEKLFLPTITMEDVLKCVGKAKPSVSNEDMKIFEEFGVN